MSSDLAQHREEDFIILWGRYPVCIKCGKRKADDPHHIVKRGNPKDPEDRKIHSSILGCAPLCRSHCHRGKLHDFDTVVELLRTVKNKAELVGYSLTELDHKFIDKYEWYYAKI